MLCSGASTSSSQGVAVMRISPSSGIGSKDAGLLAHLVLLLWRLEVVNGGLLDARGLPRDRDFLRGGDLIGNDDLVGDLDLLRLGNVFRHGDLGIAAAEAAGDQALVGRRVEVGTELAKGGFAQDAAHAFLDPAGNRQARNRRCAVHQRPLQLEGALDPLAGLDPVKALIGDQGRGAHRQRGADRAVAVEHRTQRQQVVTEALER